MSNQLRRMVVEAIEGGGRGHFGSSMSLIEIIYSLYENYLNVTKENFESLDRDRFILSKGHGCLALYAVLATRGFIDSEELRSFCRADSRLGGHPERKKIPGVEASTGALGHGLPIGVGMALAAKIQKRSSKVVVVTGDGEINEGSVWEAALSASKHKLSNLTLMIDYNKVQSYGKTSEVLSLEPLAEKLASFGFTVEEVDGHSVEQLTGLYKRLPFNGDTPSAIICHTVKGKGFPVAEGDPKWHHRRITKAEFEQLYSCVSD